MLDSSDDSHKKNINSDEKSEVSELIEYMEEYAKIFSTATKYDVALFMQLATDRIALEYFLIAKYIKEVSLNKIKEMNIHDMFEKYSESNISNNNIEDFFIENLMPIKDSLYFITRHFNVMEDMSSLEINQATKDLLNSNGVSTEINPKIKEQLISTIIQNFKTMQQAVNLSNNRSLSEFYNSIRLMSINIFLSFATTPEADKETLIKLGNESGLFSNEYLINLAKINPQVPIHSLLDVDELLDEYESNTISEERKKYLTQEDYITRLLKRIIQNDTDKIEVLLKEINIKDISRIICNLYKNQVLNYKDLFNLLSNPIFTTFDSNFKRSMRRELKAIIEFQKHPEKEIKSGIIQTFTNKAIYELATIGYISDIDLIEIFQLQENLNNNSLRNQKEEMSQNLLYTSIHNYKDSMISSEDMIKYFDANKLLKNYLKPKANNLIKILVFYRNYIITRISKEKFSEFENEILSNKQLSKKDIVTLFSVGFISNYKMKELKEKDEEIKMLLYQLVKESVLSSLNDFRNQSNRNFIFNLVYNGLITRNELANILGYDISNHIINYELDKKSIDITPENIDNLSNLGFIRDYNQLSEANNYEADILSNSLSAQEIIKFYSSGFISNEKLKELKSNVEIKNALYELISSQYSNTQSDDSNKLGENLIFYLIRFDIIDEFELLDILGSENFEKIITDGLTNQFIKAEDLSKISFIDSNLLIDTYNSNIKKRSYGDKIIDLNYIISSYLLYDNLVSINNIKKIIEKQEDSEFKAPSFNNLSNYIFQVICKCKSKIDISKIRELYLNNYLVIDELDSLVVNGIITSEEADKINKEFCTVSRIQELKTFEIQNQSRGKEKTQHSKREIDLQKLSKSQKQQIEQTDILIETLHNLGYMAKTNLDSSGLEVMECLTTEPLKDYRIFLSEQNPTSVILLHCNQVPNSNVYYNGGENITYTISTSNFYNYLVNKGNTLGLSEEELINSKYTIQTRIGKTWSTNIRKSIESIQNALTSSSIIEYSQHDTELEQSEEKNSLKK